MGYADIVADTDIERLEAKLDYLYERQNRLVDAVNGLGKNVQWIIDNVQGIFQMFQSPQFMAALPGMMNPAAMQAAADQVKRENGDTGPEAAE